MTETTYTATEKPPALLSIGATGLKQWGGYLDEEFHRELKGTKAVKVYRTMADNSAVIGAFLYVFDMFARQTEWTVEPSEHPRVKGSPEAAAIAERVQGALHDMETSWPEIVGEILTMNVFGWSALELCWKICRGEVEDPLFASKFDDGLISFRDWPIRAQESLDRWGFDDNGRWTEMHQLPPPDYRARCIPRSKLLLFRTRAHKGNPEGRSLLRNAYRAWYMQTRLEEFECIGAERETAGLHKMELPPEVFSDPARAAEKAAYQELVSKIRVDAYGGVVVPSEFDRNNMPTGYKLTRLAASGKQMADLDPSIRRKTTEQLMSMVSNWLQLGSTDSGSRALGQTMTTMGARALNGLLQSIDRVVTRDAFPQWCALNGFATELAPRLTHKELEELDVVELVDVITKLAGPGHLVLSDEDQAWLREKLRMKPVKAPAVIVPEAPRAEVAPTLDPSMAMVQDMATPMPPEAPLEQLA